MARLLDLGIDFEHWCFACGRLNPTGLQLDFDVSTNRATARYVGQRRHQGYDGTLHGGVVTALLDETMGWAIFHQGIWGVTAKLEVAFKRPVPVGEEVVVAGELLRDRGRTIETAGTVTHATTGELLAEAAGVFVRMPEAQRAELEQRYSRTDEAFARVRAAVAAEEEHKEHART
ncbi:MAG TPA: PaaI family thioesterase [Candidatus Limnocylindria bacterium]|nr:PaaI family thioesterase [Candidatus Limnocylindria bacterium]